MPRVTCSFCGLPFTVRKVREDVRYFCCSGCALASRIPMREGQLPVSRGLIVALALGFGLFNEILFGTLGAAIAAEGRVLVGERLLVVSVVLGASGLLAGAGFLLRSPARRVTDLVALAPVLALVVIAGGRAAAEGPARATWWLLLANAWIAAWLARGWGRRWLARRPRGGGGAQTGLQI